MKKYDGSDLIVSGDYLETLKKCQGYYKCPKDEDGKFVGPLVGYAGIYTDQDMSELNYVGAEYFNFSRADQWPAVLTYFAEGMAELLRVRRIEPTVILGAPMAGLKFSQDAARLLECRHIFAEKKMVPSGALGISLPQEKIVLGRYEVNPGDKVIIGEELVNNCSTTQKLIDLVTVAGGEVIGIMCAINRSYPFVDKYKGIPIVSVIECSTKQYQQHHKDVRDLVQAGKVIWKPKIEHWPELQRVMEEHGVF